MGFRQEGVDKTVGLELALELRFPCRQCSDHDTYLCRQCAIGRHAAREVEEDFGRGLVVAECFDCGTSWRVAGKERVGDDITVLKCPQCGGIALEAEYTESELREYHLGEGG